MVTPLQILKEEGHQPIPAVAYLVVFGVLSAIELTLNLIVVLWCSLAAELLQWYIKARNEVPMYCVDPDSREVFRS
jgi:hypothetical protein